MHLFEKWKCYFYVTDGWKVYPQFIPDEDQIISKTYMTRVEGENTRLRDYLARLHRKTLCYSKSLEMLGHSIRLLIHYLNWGDVPVFQVYVFYIYPGAGEKSGIKLPLGKGIPLITEAKIFKKPLRKQLKNRVELF